MTEKQKWNYADLFQQQILQKIRDNDYWRKYFMRPFQLQLRTKQSDLNCLKARQTSLPQGLLIAVKQNINDVQFISAFFKQNRNDLDQNFRDDNVDGQKQQQLAKQHKHNLITAMKSIRQNRNVIIFPKSNQKGKNYQDQSLDQIHIQNEDKQDNRNNYLQLAICVCIYSEDKQMLKDTLNGIKQNILAIITDERYKVNMDSIGVFVIFDGIQKIDPSILDYFQELQDQMFNFEEYQFNYNYNQNNYFTKYAETGDEEYIDKFYNKFERRLIYSNQQLKDRKERSFPNVYKYYMSQLKILKDIDKFKASKKNCYENMPEIVKTNYFPKIARRRFITTKGRHLDENTLQNISDQTILYQCYYQDLEGGKTLINEAIQQARNQCMKYLKAHQNLVYMATHRLEIPDKTDQEEDEGEEQQKLNYKLKTNIYMNLFMCVKYKNQGKLSSHNLFLNGFCKELYPTFVILLDVGLKSQKNAILKMFQQMKNNPKVGGVCGYMSLKIERGSQQDLGIDLDCITELCMSVADIQRIQQVQYHFAHLIDKPFEALFKFIHVLPGAFSGYRMQAIMDIQEVYDPTESLLRNYFRALSDRVKQKKTVKTNLTLTWILCKILLPDFLSTMIFSVDPDSQEQMLCNENMNLAEDRILCMGIHIKGYDLLFLLDAYSQVDPIKTLHGLFGQRKRWINGSSFAFQKVKEQLREHIKNKNNCCTNQFWLHLQMLYLSCVNAVSYFAVSLFLFTVHISMIAFQEDVLSKIINKVVFGLDLSKTILPFFVNTVDFMYAMFIGTVIYNSLNFNYNQKVFKKLIYISSTVLGIFAWIVMIVLLYDIIRGFSSSASFIQVSDIAKTDKDKYASSTNALRIIIISVFIIHTIPVILYSIIYKKFKLIVEMVFGVFAFLFYNPTYLITLNIYAICRIDDISWGTKGRDHNSSIQTQLQQTWRKIKYIHVFKYIFWNIALSTFFLSITQSYQVRVIVTMIVMGIVMSILGIKIVLGTIYTIWYRCCMQNTEKGKRVAGRCSLQLQGQIDEFKITQNAQIIDRLNNIIKHSTIESTRDRDSIYRT